MCITHERATDVRRLERETNIPLESFLNADVERLNQMYEENDGQHHSGKTNTGV